MEEARNALADESFVVWEPKPHAKDRLDDRRWAYLVDAPFDMPAHIPDLVGACVALDGRIFEVRGALPRIPQTQIRKGDLLGILLVDRTPL